jgi:hypothetical protein
MVSFNRWSQNILCEPFSWYALIPCICWLTEVYLCMFYLHSDSMEHLTSPTFANNEVCAKHSLSQAIVHCFLLGWPMSHLNVIPGKYIC